MLYSNNSTQLMAFAMPTGSDGQLWNLEPILPLPLKVEVDTDKAKLGERLFHDPQLSGDKSMSCASCHDLANGGIDGLQTSVGANGAKLSRNTPTVFNATFNSTQFWDGRTKTLEEQAAGPILNPKEMNANWPQVISRLHADPDYLTTFTALYPNGITPASITHALAEFERTLITPNSRFDQYLRGHTDAITTAERNGYQNFVQYGCIACHQGRNVGGNMFQKFGVFEEYCDETSETFCADTGRQEITGNLADHRIFRVPSLRNVAITGPYFHDGSVTTLEQAVAEMGEHQLGRDIPEKDVKLIVQFLGTLTGDAPISP